jgi:hypothetical protein
MATNVILSLLQFVIHVSDFAHALVFGQFGVAVVWMQAAVDPAC